MERGSLASNLAGRVGNLILLDSCFLFNNELKLQISEWMGWKVKLPLSTLWCVRKKLKMGWLSAGIGLRRSAHL